jgi:5-methylcytosine-specific restriction endonuclease McrA
VWRALNPAQRLAQVHRRRSRLNGEFTPTEWNALLAEYDYSCGYCRSRENITVDHRTPISRGGTNTIANLIPACLSCNSRKSDRTEDEFRHTMAVDVVAMRPPGNV